MANIVSKEVQKNPVVGLEDAVNIFHRELVQKFPSLASTQDPNLNGAIVYGIAAMIDPEPGKAILIDHRDNADGSIKALIGKPLSEWRVLYNQVILDISRSDRQR